MQYLRSVLIFTIMLLASVSQVAASAAAFDAPAVSDLELDNPREPRVFLVRGITSRLLSGSLNKLRSAPNPYASLKQWVTVKARDALKDRIINPENISLQVGSIELKNDGDVMDNVQRESTIFVGIRGAKRAAEAVPAAAAGAGEVHPL